MAFTDPQTVTINAVAQTLSRTGLGVSSGIFTKDDGTVKLSVSHQYGKNSVNARTRRQLRLDHTKYAADPLIAAQNVLRSMSVYIVVDVPKQGYTITEQKQIADALMTFLTASSGAKITQLLGGEI